MWMKNVDLISVLNVCVDCMFHNALWEGLCDECITGFIRVLETS